MSDRWITIDGEDDPFVNNEVDQPLLTEWDVLETLNRDDKDYYLYETKREAKEHKNSAVLYFLFQDEEEKSYIVKDALYDQWGRTRSEWRKIILKSFERRFEKILEKLNEDHSFLGFLGWRTKQVKVHKRPPGARITEAD